MDFEDIFVQAEALHNGDIGRFLTVPVRRVFGFVFSYTQVRPSDTHTMDIVSLIVIIKKCLSVRHSLHHATVAALLHSSDQRSFMT